MWTCNLCQTDIEDEEMFCHSCGVPRSKSAGSWVCQKCNTDVEEDAVFCSNCGQPKEEKKEPAPQPVAKSVGVTEVVISTASTPTPVSLSVEAVETPKQSVYEASVFASQFPQWDLLPPAVLVRRIKRSI